jgi:hypothetical protein
MKITINNLNNRTLLTQYSDIVEQAGLCLLTSQIVTKHDSKYSLKYHQDVPPVVLDVMHTYLIVDKEKFFMSLLKTGIKYKEYKNGF